MSATPLCGANPTGASENKKRKMFFVYILQSLKDSKRYIGSTNDISRRLEEHNEGRVKYIRNRIPFKLVHVEEYNTKEEALQREKYIKSRKGKLDFELNYQTIEEKN